MSWVAIAFIVFGAAGMLVASMARARAEGLLSSEQQNQVATAVAMSRIFWLFMQLYALFAMTLLFLVPSLPGASLQIALLFGIGAVVWSQIRLIRRVRGLNLPPRYVAVFSLSRVAMYGGWFILGLYLLSDLVLHSWS
jgi:hypothetical protein